VLYPQNGDRIVAIDFATLLHPVLALSEFWIHVFPMRLFTRFPVHQVQFSSDPVRDTHGLLFLHPTQPNPTQPIVPAHGPIQLTHLTAKHIKASAFNSGPAQYAISFFSIISRLKLVHTFNVFGVLTTTKQ